MLCLTLLSVYLVSACTGSSPKRITTNSQEVVGECRRIEHVMGETCVPNNPQRVIVLHDYLGLDAVIALGIQPIGAVGNYTGPSPFPPWLKDYTREMELVGTARQPNLEKILMLNPDLIVTLEGEGHDRIYKQLSQIAPTVIVPSERAIFPEVRFLGKVFGRTERAQALLDEYQQRLQAFRAAMGDRLTTLEVSLVRFLPEGVRIEGDSYNVGKIMKDAGLRRPSAQRIDQPMMISLEQIEKIDGDVMFVNTIAAPQLEGKANQLLEEFRQHPLWSKLKAVQNDRFYEVDPYLWSGNGILWAYEIIDDLFDYLIEDG